MSAQYYDDLDLEPIEERPHRTHVPVQHEVLAADQDDLSAGLLDLFPKVLPRFG